MLMVSQQHVVHSCFDCGEATRFLLLSQYGPTPTPSGASPCQPSYRHKDQTALEGCRLGTSRNAARELHHTNDQQASEEAAIVLRDCGSRKPIAFGILAVMENGELKTSSDLASYMTTDRLALVGTRIRHDSATRGATDGCMSYHEAR